MPYRWPRETVFERLVLDVGDRSCPLCGRRMSVCDHRHHHVFTFAGPLHLICRLVHCPDQTCPAHHRTFSPEAEMGIVMPWWVVGWDVFCWIGHRRFARHWSVPQIREELNDSHQIALSDDAIEKYLSRYQEMVAARQQDPRLLAQAYQDAEEVVLSIDGLQPEKGHETLYVVRELTKKRVWFAESLISSSQEEVRCLIIRAREWAERLGKRVRAWISDKQDAFLSGIAAEFPGVPHRYCENHFLRDLAKPVLEMDSHAKVQMRRKVRGLRPIEREILDERRRQTSEGKEDACDHDAPAEPSGLSEETGAVVLDYCVAVRGILNDNHGGPLHPPGLRMADALDEVQQSLHRNLEAKKGDAAKLCCNG
jgi:hypothetical protein